MTQKKLTLSFDNGPTENTTPQVLDVLRERNLHAYFCVTGLQLKLKNHAKLVSDTLDAGHRVVNHSLTHQVPLGEDVCAAHARTEISEMDELMNALIGDWGERWFRPFGGEGRLGQHVFSQAALAEFARLKYSVMLWNSVPRDWVDTQSWPRKALSDIDENDHTLVVLHDIDTGAMAHLADFLDEVLDRGIEITLELPEECVPIRHGQVVSPDHLKGLVAV